MGKKSSKTTSKTTYGKTTTTNPYFTSTTNNKGTTTNFAPGSAYETVNNFVNKNMGTLLDEYLNPTLNSVTNQAKMNAYTKTLNEQTKKAVENDIINPLSNRNMVRSSQATNMYNNLANSVNNSIADYSDKLLSESQANTQDIINTLLYAYLNGYTALSSNQQQSLSTSQGNASKSQNSSVTDSPFNMALQTALAVSSFLPHSSK